MSGESFASFKMLDISYRFRYFLRNINLRERNIAFLFNSTSTLKGTGGWWIDDEYRPPTEIVRMHTGYSYWLLVSRSPYGWWPIRQGVIWRCIRTDWNSFLNASQVMWLHMVRFGRKAPWKMACGEIREVPVSIDQRSKGTVQRSTKGPITEAKEQTQK